jgi:NADH-quinone oxidoreductase subunit J
VTALQVVFFYLAAAIVVSSGLAVTRRNPVHSVLWMLAVFVHVACVYLLLNAEFLAAIQIIIYAGAVLVLFLFVLMLLNLGPPELEHRFVRHWRIGVGLALAYVLALTAILGRLGVSAPTGPYSVELTTSQGGVRTLGRVLYTEFLLPFEIASLVLLVAIIGAIALTLRRAE